MRLIGCDFTSAPRPRKPIVVALGRLVGDRVELEAFERFTALDAFGRWLKGVPEGMSGWVGGFDLPFGLPRELVEDVLGRRRNERAFLVPGRPGDGVEVHMVKRLPHAGFQLLVACEPIRNVAGLVRESK